MPGDISRFNGKKGGRPKGSKGKSRLLADQALEYIRKRVTAELEPIMNKALEQAKTGDSAARKDIMDRAYGKAKETVEHQGLEFTWE